MKLNTLTLINQLSSPTKINIICWILKYPEGITISKLIELTELKRNNISKQINEMKNVGMLNSRHEGKTISFTMSDIYHSEQIKLIYAAVNSFHFIDEDKKDHVFYK